jgi:hypothetical protein
MLDNSFGPWKEYYSKGPESTWLKSIGELDFYVKYHGRKPRFEKLNYFVNKFIVSRPGTYFWKCVNWSIRRKLPKVTKVSADILQVDCFESWNNISRKTVAALDYCFNNYEFDYLVRCNSTLYTNPEKVRDYLTKIQDPYFYGGPTQDSKNFIAGWCIIMSRDVIKVILNSYGKKDFELFDDESIGNILRRNNIHQNAISHAEINEKNSKTSIIQISEQGNFIWRIKNNSKGKRISVSKMKSIHTWLSEPKK